MAQIQAPASQADRTILERIVLHERAILVAALVAIPLVCWSWIVPMARDMYGTMTGPSAWMMTTTWDVPHLLLLCAMWIVMMIGMMLPSASPALLIYARVARRRADAPHSALRVYAMGGGYLLAWIAFSIAATLLQRVLSARLALSPMMALTSPFAAATLLVIAGVYQLTPLKRACLASCSAPMTFLTRRWRDGTAGAFRLGIEHGLYCVGCCWALMLLLFAGGVMNLTVIAALTAFVLCEKLAPLGAQGGRLSGVLLIGVGLSLTLR